MPKVTIDGTEITVGKTTSIFAAARKAGIEIPHFCHHFALKPVARCRMCLVEIEGWPKLTPSCSTTCADGMVIHTKSPLVEKARQAMLEFLLTTHPYECPICDQAGECDLQNYAYDYGRDYSRYIEEKEQHELKQLGPHVYHWPDRCILCTRCVRFASEISGTNELTVVYRGADCEIDTFSDKQLDNKLSGNVVDICPVGAMLSADSLYKSREWLLQRTESICPLCSTGCNIYIDTWKDKIIRIKPRVNQSVNGFWICDSGRYHFTKFTSNNRLTRPQRRAGKAFFPLSWDEAGKIFKQKIKRIIGLYGNDSVAVLGSPYSSNEDNFLLSQFAEKCFKTYAKAILWHKPTEDNEVFKSGFTIDADKSPNLAGAKEMLQTQDDVIKGFNQIIEQIVQGDIKALYIIGGNLSLHLSEPEKQALTKLEFLAVNEMFHNEITEIAHLVLPAASTFEKDGTFINSRGRIQLFKAALNPPDEAKADWEIIQLLSKHFLESFAYESAEAIFSKIATTFPLLQGLSHDNIGIKGKILEHSVEQKV